MEGNAWSVGRAALSIDQTFSSDSSDTARTAVTLPVLGDTMKKVALHSLRLHPPRNTQSQPSSIQPASHPSHPHLDRRRNGKGKEKRGKQIQTEPSRFVTARVPRRPFPSHRETGPGWVQILGRPLYFGCLPGTDYVDLVVCGEALQGDPEERDTAGELPFLDLTKAARFFSAIKPGIDDLRAYYKDARTRKVEPLQPNTPHPRFFPYPTKFRCRQSKETISFRYLNAMDDGDSRNLVYLAQTQPRKLIAKFSDRYGYEAHQLLADAKNAPELFYCGLLDGEGDVLDSEKAKRRFREGARGLHWTDAND
ncbi:hypothetical protein D9758_004950 [Tetrapyrgos nigripes]|uniref:Uncharacterized protein n=1 Tax=Tetrapyrgos nigripes TaxID=182062 RepID=A0A8H5LWM6_9AGAR|nr:hypothetical protein D9758_004950 [Tetrapyrgos nigripes]